MKSNPTIKIEMYSIVSMIEEVDLIVETKKIITDYWTQKKNIKILKKKSKKKKAKTFYFLLTKLLKRIGQRKKKKIGAMIFFSQYYIFFCNHWLLNLFYS